MNFTLLDKIERVLYGVLATILATTGHTYKKKGEKALFEKDNPFPVYGNFGSQCVDQDLVVWAAEAFASGVPRKVHVDTTDVADVDFGYGVYCGGELDILLEPVLERHKDAYRELRQRLEKNEPCFFVHNLDTGDLQITGDTPQEKEGVFAERITPPVDVVLFGATPLARRLVAYLEDTDFRPFVMDWREAYLDKFEGMCDTVLFEGDLSFDPGSLVLVLSHSFSMDKKALTAAIEKGCPYVGMLSSTKRRDKIFEELAQEGVTKEALDQVHSPVGLDIKAKSDPEIAVGIVAELTRFKNS